MSKTYTGRFAPSPTGPLHFGSLVAAMGSYLEAKSHGGRWLLRIEDLDPPREVKGATHSIIRSLDKLGFEWDGDIAYQSMRGDRYVDALDRLASDGFTFYCRCTRKQLAGLKIYPGICRARRLQTEGSCTRLRVRGEIEFTDAVQGQYLETLETDCGDFIVRRRDGLFAYQLAVVVDDAEQGVTHVVRGADLLDNTPRQIFLQRLLRISTPQYCHLPVAANSSGKKLSKQTCAKSIDEWSPLAALGDAWCFLGQAKFEAPARSIGKFWQLATALWDVRRVPKTLSALMAGQSHRADCGIAHKATPDE